MCSLFYFIILDFRENIIRALKIFRDFQNKEPLLHQKATISDLKISRLNLNHRILLY